MRAETPVQSLAPALQFVLACCRWPRDAQFAIASVQAAREVADWNSVFECAEAHRVEALVAHAIRGLAGEIPADVLAWAQDVRETMRRRAPVEIAETLRLSTALGAADIPFRLLKGAALGSLVYGQPALKRSWDIDVLVLPTDAQRAAKCIAELDYVPTKPPRPLDAAEFQRWSAVSKHAEYASTRGMTIELHWRVSSLPFLLEGIDATSPQRLVPILGNHLVPTLSDASQLAYLCVHGCAHGWSRLKWFADFSAFASARSTEELALLVTSADMHGTGDALGAAFLLRASLLGYEIPSTVRQSARTVELARLSLQVMQSRQSGRAIEADRAARRAIEKICASLVPGLRYRVEYLRRRHRGSEIRQLVALPRYLHWAYWMIRPYSFIRRAAARLSA